jgi:hypothetical protein
VILLTPHERQDQAGWEDYLMYAALTRTRQNLVVFNRSTRYHAYGASWPKHWQTPMRIF